MQHIARSREAAGGVVPVQIGAGKGKCKKGKDVIGEGELMQAEK